MAAWFLHFYSQGHLYASLDTQLLTWFVLNRGCGTHDVSRCWNVQEDKKSLEVISYLIQSDHHGIESGIFLNVTLSIKLLPTLSVKPPASLFGGDNDCIWLVFVQCYLIVLSTLMELSFFFLNPVHSSTARIWQLIMVVKVSLNCSVATYLFLNVCFNPLYMQKNKKKMALSSV